MKRRNRKLKNRKLKIKLLFVVGIALPILTIPLTSCRSCPRNDLFWTDPPSPIVDGESVVKHDPEKQEVIMPDWYWFNLMDYIIDTEANKEKLKN